MALGPSPASAETKDAKNKKAKPTAAKKKASSSDKKAGNASPAAATNQAWETPPSGDLTKTPPPPPPPPPVESKPESPPAAAAPPAEAPAAPPVVVETPPVAPAPRPLPQPIEEETLPAFIPQPSAPPTQWVEHLGASAYPGNGPYPGWSWWRDPFRWGPEAYAGQMRGLYGGSLWLEPSFHGLQWPYMAKTGVGISGSAWVDSGYEKITRENPQVQNTKRWLQQGRAVLRVTPTYTKGRFFVQAQAELVGNGCQSTGDATSCNPGNSGTVDTDDLWVRFGQWNMWDLKVGRFEGWEVYHTGMGLDVNTLERRGAWDATSGVNSGLTAPDYYGVTFLHDRPRGMGLGYVALHAYPLSVLRLELLGQLGTNDISNDGNNYLGTRPVVIFDIGWLKLKAGYEYQKIASGGQSVDAGVKTDRKHKTTSKGYGGSFQLIFNPYVEIGGNIAQGSVSYINDQGDPDTNNESHTVTSAGAFANVRLAPRGSVVEDLMLGLGIDWTTWYGTYKLGSYDANYAAQLQIFGALQYLIAKQLFVKAVVAYARADLDPSGSHAPGQGDLNYSNVMWSTRIRLMYLY
jgi:hypothetical protein